MSSFSSFATISHSLTHSLMAFPQRKRTPSFSSSVLDSIYRSIDESDGFQSEIKESNKNENVSLSSSSSSPPPPKRNDDKLTTLRRAIMDDEHWLYSRTSTTTTTTATTTTSSADSSSETESYLAKRRSRKLADQGNDRLAFKLSNDKNLKAVKLHEELKRPKQKQPVSPGARLTSFLNSIFQSNAKKVKLCAVGKTTDVKSTSSSSCFSRTRCKTDNNNTNNLKTSVRFYPVRVTVDGVSIYDNKKKPIPELTGKKSVGRVTSLKEEIKANYIHRTDHQLTCITRKIGLKNSLTSYRAEEEDDVWSYSSSDLFELDNQRIVMGRYIKELPVYETTDFKTNQAIARGLLL